jgi:hypothetical protein
MSNVFLVYAGGHVTAAFSTAELADAYILKRTAETGVDVFWSMAGLELDKGFDPAPKANRPAPERPKAEAKPTAPAGHDKGHERSPAPPSHHGRKAA